MAWRTNSPSLPAILLWSIPSLRRWGEVCPNMAQYGRPQSSWKAAYSPFTTPTPISTGRSRVRGRYGWQREGRGKGMEEEEVEMCSAISRCIEVTSGLWGQCWGPSSGLSQHPICWPRNSFQTSWKSCGSLDFEYRPENLQTDGVWASQDKRKRGLFRKWTWLSREENVIAEFLY